MFCDVTTKVYPPFSPCKQTTVDSPHSVFLGSIVIMPLLLLREISTAPPPPPPLNPPTKVKMNLSINFKNPQT
jgi:hypothetical protein